MSAVPRVRLAPSPTGDPHIGTAYMALFDYAFARQQGGQFILRIEDTDQARYNADSERRIYAALHWLGLSWDEGPDVGGPHSPYRQSERLPIYQEYARQLVREGHAYQCFCTLERLEQMRQEQKARHEPPRYDRRCLRLSPDEVRERLAAGERAVIRMKMPEGGETTFHDLVRGDIAFQNALQDDAVILKSDGFPTYHLAVVVDDHLMGITHVVRGEEWISSTPKHVTLYRDFGWEMPAFIHMPLMRNPDKSKISKRKNHTSVEWYRDQGFLPAALLNFLALQGWSMPDGREVFSLDEFIANFTWERISLGGPIFDMKRLDDLNGLSIRALSLDDFIVALAPWTPMGVDPLMLRAIAPLVQTRINRLSEFPRLTDFFFHEPDYTASLLRMLGEPKPGIQKIAAWLRAADPTASLPEAADAATLEQEVRAALLDPHTGARSALRALLYDEKLGMQGAIALLHKTYRLMEGSIEPWDRPSLETQFRAFWDREGIKLRQPTDLARVAITGSTSGPPLFESMEVLGRDRCLARTASALALAGGGPAA